jgi:hypothetical protein
MKNTIEVPQKYNFSLFKSSKITDNIGIPEARWDEINTKCKEVVIRAYFTDDSINSITKAYEVFLNDVKPQSFIEAFVCGLIFESIDIQIKKLKNV